MRKSTHLRRLGEFVALLAPMGELRGSPVGGDVDRVGRRRPEQVQHGLGSLERDAEKATIEPQ
jgi:hypothetical protein